MLAIECAKELAQRDETASRALQPGPVNAVAGAINIASPDAFQAQKQIAIAVVRGDFVQLIGKTMRASRRAIA